jgi:hypothetical protein
MTNQKAKRTALFLLAKKEEGQVSKIGLTYLIIVLFLVVSIPSKGVQVRVPGQGETLEGH